jgi:hypothetical protein
MHSRDENDPASSYQWETIPSEAVLLPADVADLSHLNVHRSAGEALRKRIPGTKSTHSPFYSKI